MALRASVTTDCCSVDGNFAACKGLLPHIVLTDSKNIGRHRCQNASCAPAASSSALSVGFLVANAGGLWRLLQVPDQKPQVALPCQGTHKNPTKAPAGSLFSAKVSLICSSPRPYGHESVFLYAGNREGVLFPIVFRRNARNPALRLPLTLLSLFTASLDVSRLGVLPSPPVSGALSTHARNRKVMSGVGGASHRQVPNSSIDPSALNLAWNKVLISHLVKAKDMAMNARKAGHDHGHDLASGQGRDLDQELVL